jgi:hypothetical protein
MIRAAIKATCIYPLNNCVEDDDADVADRVFRRVARIALALIAANASSAITDRPLACARASKSVAANASIRACSC